MVGTATPTAHSPLPGSGVTIQSAQPKMVEQLVGDIKTRLAAEQPEGEDVSDNEKIGEVNQISLNGGKRYTDWIVHFHDRPPDGGGGAPDLIHEGAVGEGKLCSGHDGGGVPDV